LLDAGQVLRTVEGSLLCAPSQDLCASDLALAVSVCRTQIDVSKSQFDDVDVALFKELEFLAE
jgi:hypothetical protein